MNQKLENLLNLSLSTGNEDREKSPLLQAGYDSDEQTWELIVKYHGNIKQYESSELFVEELIAGYAIVTIRERLIEAFSLQDEIEYVEKPKPFYFQVLNGIQESCITYVKLREPLLTGRGVLCAIIDSGIDYVNQNFRNQDGSTRIVSLWDQTIQPNAALNRNPPIGFQTGVEFSQQDINVSLEGMNLDGEQEVLSRDVTGHGTAVAGIAAANGTNLEAVNEGVAPESELIVVKLGSIEETSFPGTTQIMRAVTYVLRKAMERNQPLAINLSFGNSYGDHRGNSLLERFLDNASEIGKTSVVVGTGNEGVTAGHLSGVLRENTIETIEMAMGSYELSMSLQLWKNYNDIFDLTLVSPAGARIPISINRFGTFQVQTGMDRLLIFVGEPLPYSVNQEIFITFIPTRQYLTEGIWRLEMVPLQIVSGDYNCYLPSAVTRNSNTQFFLPTPQVTLTIPSTARKVISVGAYSTYGQRYADFSGRGYVDTTEVEGISQFEGVGQNRERVSIPREIKPDLVAPGVGITTVSVRGGYETVSGTSFATPFVTGSAALLMEWGIVRGNDPFLYGEKLKAYLIKGARQLPGTVSPNPMTGWGALCVADALPI